MTAADDAHKAIAHEFDMWGSEQWGDVAGRPGRALAAEMPDGEMIAQHLDDGATAERMLRKLTKVEWLTTDWHIDVQTGQVTCWRLGDECDPAWEPLAAVDPEAAALLARLDAET